VCGERSAEAGDRPMRFRHTQAGAGPRISTPGKQLYPGSRRHRHSIGPAHQPAHHGIWCREEGPQNPDPRTVPDLQPASGQANPASLEGSPSRASNCML
jgi:hypothetical protein